MNTPKTMALGWGSLVAAAGVSFYYAKKSIDERRRAQEVTGSRPTEKLDWKARIAQQERGVQSDSVDSAVTTRAEGGESIATPSPGRSSKAGVS